MLAVLAYLPSSSLVCRIASSPSCATTAESPLVTAMPAISWVTLLVLVVLGLTSNAAATVPATARLLEQKPLGEDAGGPANGLGKIDHATMMICAATLVQLLLKGCAATGAKPSANALFVLFCVYFVALAACCVHRSQPQSASAGTHRGVTSTDTWQQQQQQCCQQCNAITQPQFCLVSCC